MAQEKNEKCALDIQLGRRLKMFRRQKHISQKVLGKSIGVSFQQIQKYESGKSRLSASKLFTIAGLFELPLSAFFEGFPADTSPLKGKLGSIDSMIVDLPAQDRQLVHKVAQGLICLNKETA